MSEDCPYLEYRSLSDGAGSDDTDTDTAEPRAYCTAAHEFVQPMRADICNDRYDLDHETDCEIYRDHEGLSEVPNGGKNSEDAEDETATTAGEGPDG
ncbi:hypothetical protein [Halorussus salinisoli]|uniref:hypothetical protein n=1 Tax=Halorussus salinisoli TaxID=2558242 RepID=UPI002A90AFFD|nr:hypothetical protein [Halorussus salinisoli]